ncbi:MAG: siderophore-interacting protein [Leucobacter sp.]|jgi:NADPH-dependent ferric siderophore reductase|nr:siderophore-interacting protein [Leucobacter sp.]
MVDVFERERVMHGISRRKLTVLRSELVAPRMQRVTLGGAELEGFVAFGPADHVKVFLPDPADGKIYAPEFVDGRRVIPEGSGEIIVRDYTPYSFRPDAEDGPELDIDFVLHGDGSEQGGPAPAWAASAKPGSELVIAGPRGSVLAPVGAASAILVADESALPAAARWLDAFADTPVIGLFAVADAGTASYLASREGSGRELRWFTGEDRDAQVAEALRGIEIGEATFVFAAGEANSLIGLRKYLRRELGLPKDQVNVQGYWKRGVVALDHHASLDPSDPED